MSSSSKLTPAALREMTPEALINTLVTTKSELLILRQKKHSAIVKPSDIKQKRQEIARINTILYEQKVAEIVKDCKLNKKPLPKELLPRRTRKIRNGLTKKQEKMSKNGRFRRVKMPLFAYNSA